MFDIYCKFYVNVFQKDRPKLFRYMYYAQAFCGGGSRFRQTTVNIYVLLS